MTHLCERHAALIDKLLPEDWCGACESTMMYQEGIAEGKRLARLEVTEMLKKLWKV